MRFSTKPHPFYCGIDLHGTALQNPCTHHVFVPTSHASQGQNGPSNSRPTPSSRHRHTQLLTDACRSELEDLTMAWH
jgi:hypothetical protein